MSSNKKIIQRYIDLIKIINENNLLYHTYDNPKLSDSEFDELYNELKLIEKDNPSIISNDSPTQRIGSTILDQFQKVNHEVPMLSLSNASDSAEFKDFYNKLCSSMNVNNTVLFAEPKFDGLAVSINYKNSIFYNAVTRGDGMIGEDVSENVKTIKSLPMRLENSRIPDNISLRGEIFIDKRDFMEINSKLEESNEKSYSNPRNLAAGSIRQLNPTIAASRKLKLFIHGVSNPNIFTNIATHNEMIEIINKSGLPTNNYSRLVNNLSESLDYFKNMMKERDTMPYEIDGLVYRVNDLSKYKQIGFTSKYPKWAIAYKFKSLEAVTKIRDVTFQVGRTGTITPVAELETVNIGGVNVSRATLHNFSEIESKDIRIGDYVFVKRAGDVIPDIDRVDFNKRNKTKKINKPKYCPSCNSILKKIDGQIAYKCLNAKKCLPQIEQSIIHFISRKGANINGIGDQIIKELVAKKIICQSTDLYSLSENDFKKLDRVGDKSISNYLNSIEKSKRINFDKFIYALGIKEVGEASSKSLARKFSDVTSLINCSIDDLIQVSDIGPIVADNIINYLSDKDNLLNIKSLLKNGLKLVYKKSLDKNVSIVITGSLKSISRSELTNKLETLGYKVNSSVTKNTDILICGDNPGSKKDKALKFKIKIISEVEAIKLL